MVRPRLWYVVWFDDRRMSVVQGRAQASALSHSFRSFRTEDAAQEFAAWWYYEHPPWWREPKNTTE